MTGEIMVNIQIEPLENGEYLATSEELDGLIAQGRTVAETIEIARDVARKLIEAHIAHGDPLPESVQRALEAGNSGVTVLIPVSIPEYAAT